MPSMKVQGGTREASISAVVIRADGRREDLGVVSYWSKNPFKRLAWNLGRFLRSLRNRY